MADTSARPSRLMQLPLELMHMVVDQMNKKELKALRASNKFFNKLLTPILFRCFTVYPHVRSFEHLMNAARTPHIESCIQHLKYDAGWVGVTDIALRRLQSVYSASISEDEQKSMLEHARSLHSQALTPDNALDEMALMNYLERAFTALCHLESISVYDAYRTQQIGESHGELPSFYEQLTGETCGRFEHTRLEVGMVGAGYARTTYLRALLMALRNLESPLCHFELQRVRWPYLLQQGDLGKHIDFWRKSFEGLKALELTTATEAMPAGPNAMSNLQTLLKPAVNLEELGITFRSVPDARYYGANMKDAYTDVRCQSVFQTHRGDSGASPDAGRLTWSDNLRNLRLEGLVCTSKEIKSILKRSAKTLRQLEIGSLVLMPDVLPGRRACLVELFQWMQKHLQLEEIILTNFLTNGGMQYWFLGWTNDEKKLYVRVQNFILKGGPNPLAHVAIQPGYFDLHKKTYAALVPEVLIEGNHNGDSTFSMEYEDEEEMEDEEENETDELDSDSDDLVDDDDDLFLGPPPYAFPMPLMDEYDLGEWDEDAVSPGFGMGL